jgi:long-chain acyl-CoA synthetase
MFSAFRETVRVDRETLSSLTQYTFPQILAKQAERLGSEKIAIREKAYGIWEVFSWSDYYRHVRLVGLGLSALGLRRGENLAIITDNHAEWLFSELGAQSMGAITLNLYTSSVTKELTYGLNRIQAAYAVAQDQEQVDKLIEARSELKHVRRVVYLDPTGLRGLVDDPWLISFSGLLELGRELDEREPECFQKALWLGKPEDVALMIMTSGTTGPPKLAMLTYGNITEMATKWLETAPIGAGDNWISITPPAWIVDQMCATGVAIMGGLTMNFPEAPETSTEDSREIGPNLMISSSRFWEDLASRIRVKISDSGVVKRWIYSLGQRIGTAVVDRESRKEPIPIGLKILRWLASWTCYRPLLDRVGCLRLRASITGGHPISPDVIRFFRANGLNLKQAYGLTEAGGIFQVQPDDEVKPETVGKPLPRTKIKIDDDQEVLVSSASNFIGYYQDTDATDTVFTDGWLHTGDAGYMDDDGHLVIIGRKSEIMRTRDGEAFSPDFIETRLKFSPYIKEVVTFGEGMPYLTAMVNIDMENVGNWAEERQIPFTTYADLSQQPSVEALIREEIMEINKRLPKAMKPRKFVLLYKLLDADDEELTRTGKVRRKFVYDQYRELIQAMYTDETGVKVKGQVRYRDGHVGTISTTVRILTLEDGSEQ